MYTTIDLRIRTLANTTVNPQRIHDAQELSTGASNKSFSMFASAVDQLSTVNHTYYNSTYSAMNAMLTLLILLSITLFPLLGLVAVWGTSRRLKDF